jgi:serine/threonine protein kinase
LAASTPFKAADARARGQAANVIREYGGRIVLTDFGAGRFRGIEPKGEVVGTPHYVAPEVMAGGEATDLSDIYSVGVLLYRLVTVSYPRPAPDELCENHGSGPPTLLRDLRADLSEAFLSAVEPALSRDPRHRPRSAGALSAGHRPQRFGLLGEGPSGSRQADVGLLKAVPRLVNPSLVSAAVL